MSDCLLHLLATTIDVTTALLWAVSGWFWWASARASLRAKIYASPMAPGRPAVSTDWLAEFRQAQIPVQRNNSLAAWFAAAAGGMGVLHAIIGLF
jgi:hypothetical protein